jgi:ribose transport system substrate-binding protein
MRTDGSSRGSTCYDRPLWKQLALSATTNLPACRRPSDYPKESFTKAVGIGCENIDEYYDPNSVF